MTPTLPDGGPEREPAPGSGSARDGAGAGDQATVLLLDEPQVADAVQRMLAGHPDIAFHHESQAAAAHAAARRLRPTVILLAPVLAGADGFALLAALRADPLLRAVPVVLLAAADDAGLRARGFAAGAIDFVVKPPAGAELAARLRHHSGVCTALRQRDAALRSLHATQEQLARAEQELERVSTLDGLTGIGNRRRFEQALAVEWQRARRLRVPLSLLLCDIDRFRDYNDSLGHAAGDHCLQAAATLLDAAMRRPADLVTRHGGAQFAILVPDTGLAGALKLGEDCRRQFELAGLPHAGGAGGVVTLSVGVANAVPAEGGSPEALVDAAEAALRDAKRGGRNRVAARAAIRF